MKPRRGPARPPRPPRRDQKPTGGAGGRSGARGGPPIAGPAGPILERLFAGKGIAPGEWWPFFVQGEGKDLPGGIESQSGFVLTRDGRVFGWWLDAGPDGAPTLDRWWPVEDPDREFAHDPEFAAAKRRLRR